MTADTVPTVLHLPSTIEERVDCALRHCAAMSADGTIRLVRGDGRRKAGRPPYWHLDYPGVAWPVPRVAAWTVDEALAWANDLLAHRPD